MLLESKDYETEIMFYKWDMFTDGASWEPSDMWLDCMVKRSRRFVAVISWCSYNPGKDQKLFGKGKLNYQWSCSVGATHSVENLDSSGELEEFCEACCRLTESAANLW